MIISLFRLTKALGIYYIVIEQIRYGVVHIHMLRMYVLYPISQGLI